MGGKIILIHTNGKKTYTEEATNGGKNKVS